MAEQDAAEIGRKPDGRTDRIGTSRGAVVTYCLYNHDGKLLACHLCGHSDRWTLESEGAVFVCEHEPISLVRGAVRQLSSVPARVVAAYEFVGMKHEAPVTPDSPPWMGAVGV
ncbi:MAG: hypothetical protein QN178_16860 [Armatimonadota bacterium]|nr:hypothetical protein [Armatimonadota bacterium]